MFLYLLDEIFGSLSQVHAQTPRHAGQGHDALVVEPDHGGQERDVEDLVAHVRDEQKEPIDELVLHVKVTFTVLV